MTNAKKPCIALLGEFSAGKSTLANVLLGSDQSPVQVTATRMPPVRYVAGEGQCVQIDRDGGEHALQLADIGALDLEETLAIQVGVPSPFLERCDLIDMPGSSDPNMPGDIWGSLMPEVDIAIWCTPATQAWRQSEAALWDAVPEAVRRRSLLLLTRIDKVDRIKDRDRLVARVCKETDALFRRVLPVSLLQDTPDPAAGRAALLEALDDLILHPDPQAPPAPTPVEAPAPTVLASVRPRRVVASKALAPPPQPRRVASKDRLI